MADGIQLRGRAEPLRLLRDSVAAAATGRGRITVLSGEAGIGKSALASTIADEASEADAQVTWGRAWEFADAPPYFPLLPCLRTLDVDLGEASNAFALWERVLAALARASRDRLVVWMLEDLHAADLGTLDLLTFLAQPLRAMRVLIVATVRPHDPRLGERQLQRVARIARDGQEIRLEPLSESDVAAVAEDTLGRAVDAAVTRRLVELSGGNPLFVVECARAARAAGSEALSPADKDRMIAALPPTVRQIVLERVALLPEATRRALEAGAILGRELAAATVARMLESTPARVIDELVPALRAGVVRELRAGTFGFSHVLVRDAIEDALGEDQRARLHGSADRAIAALGDSAEILVERARHCLATRGDPAHALELVDRAATLLEREGAFDRAFELWTRVTDARAAGLLPPATAEQILRVATVAREAGRGDRTRELCDEVIEKARAAGDGELFGRAVLLHATDVRVGVLDHVQIALLEETRTLVGAETALGCRLGARLATALQPADDPARPNQLARDSLERAHALADDAVILDVLGLGAFGMFGASRAERLAWSSELRDRALRANNTPKALNALSMIAMWSFEIGEFATFEEVRTAALVLSEGQHPRYRWDSLMLASGSACALGKFAESDRYLAEVSQIAALVDDPSLAIVPIAHEFARAKLRRRRDEVMAILPAFEAVARQLHRGSLYFEVQRAHAATRYGDHATAREVIDQLGSQIRVLEFDPEAMANLGEMFAVIGTEAQCRWSRDMVARQGWSEMFGFGLSYTYEGSTERILGLLDAALGELESAETKLRHSLELARERMHAPWVAMLARELGGVVARRGRADEARALRDEAAAIDRALGIGELGGVVDEPKEAGALRMVKTGDVWTIERGKLAARIKDSRGVQLLQRLTERPGEEIHVLSLASDEGVSAPESSAGEAIDASARKAYKKRLAELETAIATAEQAGNAAAATRLDRERAVLVKELARASGLGGRTRQTGSATERARINVQRRLKEVIARVADANAELGQFLDVAIRTGTFCCFRP